MPQIYDMGLMALLPLVMRLQILSLRSWMPIFIKDLHWKQPKKSLTLILLTWRIWWAPNNATKWKMGFNLAFKGLKPIQMHIALTQAASNILTFQIPTFHKSTCWAGTNTFNSSARRLMCRMKEKFRYEAALTFQSLAISLRTTTSNSQKFYMVLALRWAFCTDRRTNSDF